MPHPKVQLTMSSTGERSGSQSAEQLCNVGVQRACPVRKTWSSPDGPSVRRVTLRSVHARRESVRSAAMP